MVGSIGRGAGIGALSNGVSNMCVTTIDYLAEHGNLNGALDDIAMSGFSGIVSGGILGGISGGIRFNSPSKTAKSWQGKDDYPGIDDLIKTESQMAWKIKKQKKVSHKRTNKRK